VATFALMHPVVVAGRGAWREIFTNPQYRGRTVLLVICWLLGYAGLIYGAGAFAAVYMVDHGATPHFVFATIAGAYAVTFLAFQLNAWLGERIERREVMFFMALLFAASWLIIYMSPACRSLSYSMRSAGSGQASGCSSCTTTPRWRIRREFVPSHSHGPTVSDILVRGPESPCSVHSTSSVRIISAGSCGLSFLARWCPRC
jgi:MFS family permease